MSNNYEVMSWWQLAQFWMALYGFFIIPVAVTCLYAERTLCRAKQVCSRTASALRCWLSGPEACDRYPESYLRKHIQRMPAWIDAYIAVWSLIIASSFYWMNATVPFTALSFVCSCALGCYAIWALLKMNAQSRQFKRDVEDSPWMRAYRLMQ